MDYLEIDPRNPDIVYAATKDFFGPPGGVYKSTDGGYNWEEKNNGLSDDDRDINVIKINPQNADELFIGTGSLKNNILFNSVDGGDNWKLFNAGLPDSGGVRAIEIDTLNNRIYICVGGGWNESGIYIYYDLSTSISDYILQNFQTFELYQNYPNPFNNLTTIKYKLEKSNFIKLSVYDILGKEVKLLVNEYQYAGSYQKELNLNGLPSGLYLYRLETGEQALIRKAILLK